MKKLFKTVAIITIFSILTRVLGFVLRILLSRSIGAEGLGIYQIAFSFFMILETLISSGLPFTISKMTAENNAQNKKEESFKLVTAALIVGLILSIIIITTILLFKNFLGNIFADKRCLAVLITLLPSLIFSSTYAVIRGYFWGEKRYFWVSVTEFFEQIARVVFFVLLTTIGFAAIEEIIAAPLSLVFACALSCLFVIIVFFRLGGKLKNPKGKFKPILKVATPITAVRLVSSLLMPLIGIIIPITMVYAGYTNEQALTEYGIAIGMTFPLLHLPSTLIGSLAMTLIPDIASDMAINKKDIASKRIEASIKFSIFITFIVVPLYIGLGSSVGLFLYDNTTSGIYLSKAAWIMVPMSINNIAASSLNAMGLEVKSFTNYLIGSVFLFLSLIFLPKYIGILSLVVGMGVCMSIATVLNIKMLNKKLKNNLSFLKHITSLILISIPVALIANWTNNILQNFMPLFFSLAISSTLSAIIFILTCEVFKIANISSLFIDRKKKKQTV